MPGKDARITVLENRCSAPGVTVGSSVVFIGL